MKRTLLFVFMLVSADSYSQEWIQVSLSEIDTSTLKIEKTVQKYGNGKIKTEGAYRIYKMRYGNYVEWGVPVGRHVDYFRNGKIHRADTYNQTGFSVSDTIWWKNGKLRYVAKYETVKSYILGNGKTLRWVDRHYYITFYRKNGNKESEGNGLRDRGVWLKRTGLWKFYNKDGSFKYESTYN